MTKVLQGGLCQQKHRHRNADSKIGPGGQENRPETQEKRPKTTKTERNSGTLPRPKGFLYQRPYRTPGSWPEPAQNLNLRRKLTVRSPLPNPSGGSGAKTKIISGGDPRAVQLDFLRAATTRSLPRTRGRVRVPCSFEHRGVWHRFRPGSRG